MHYLLVQGTVFGTKIQENKGDVFWSSGKLVLLPESYTHMYSRRQGGTAVTLE